MNVKLLIHQIILIIFKRVQRGFYPQTIHAAEYVNVSRLTRFYYFTFNTIKSNTNDLRCFIYKTALGKYLKTRIYQLSILHIS